MDERSEVTRGVRRPLPVETTCHAMVRPSHPPSARPHRLPEREGPAGPLIASNTASELVRKSHSTDKQIPGGAYPYQIWYIDLHQRIRRSPAYSADDRIRRPSLAARWRARELHVYHHDRDGHLREL